MKLLNRLLLRVYFCYIMIIYAVMLSEISVKNDCITGSQLNKVITERIPE